MSQPTSIGILGGGESGIGAALLAMHMGIPCFLSEGKTLGEAHRAELESAGIPFEEGRHDLERLLTCEVIIKSPGIPSTTPIMAALLAQGKEIWSDIEWFYRCKPAQAKVAAITGSNGKTTTTAWLGHIMEQSGANVRVGGNIGVGAGRLLLGPAADIYVLEVSSYQLEFCPSFRPHVAVLTNITPDHLDRYGNLENYAKAKFQITAHQGPEDAFLYYAEDPVTLERLERVQAKRYPIYTTEPRKKPQVGAFPEAKHYTIIPHPEEAMTIEELALQGKHNSYNALAAGLSARLLQVRSEMVRESLAHFEGLEHRMESVGHVHGIHFVNDSKATNVNSTYYALESMKTPVVWILGGVDKGNDYSELYSLVDKKVKAVIALGADVAKIRVAFGDRVEIYEEVSSMDAAVRSSYLHATKGETVLLSPCCASFDLFQNYQDRGQQFKAAVRKL
ncbi:UDP-N-acetylmuramoyl-L-alanine--D-glutamate ligase [Schleiferiaceae bacterium]|nr:UDP-N-acetylmuramoyl-L-alanine--D-glutamate ligase [Schleiferiaceae bacterium]